MSAREAERSSKREHISGKASRLVNRIKGIGKSGRAAADEQIENKREPDNDNFFNRTSSALDSSKGALRHKLRFSLSLRISFNYAGIVLRSLPLHLFIVLLAVALLNVPRIMDTQASARRALSEASLSPGQRITSPVSLPGLWVEAYDEAGIRLLGEIPQAAIGRLLSYDSAHRQVYLKVESDLSQPSGRYRLVYVHSLGSALQMTLLAMGLTLLLSVMHIARFLRRGGSLNQRVLHPIQDIAEAAQNLSGSNLSQRIQVEGQKTELRDLAGVINDMLDRIEASLGSQRRFVSDASHELRTPIAVIQGYVDLLDRWGKDNPEVRDEAISAIKSETAAMKDLVENLLFLARHDNRPAELALEFFDARELVDEVLRETALIAQGKVIASSTMESCILNADRAALKQALRAFVSNAVKYTPTGGRVTLSVRRRDGQCVISVRDSGSGIDSTEMEHIFERFYRADKVRSGGIEGHGLGLAIARIIIAGHGGAIEVRSALGKGSVFSILLPV